MVAGQLRGRGISDERVLEAMGAVAREGFVRDRDRAGAYADRALAIDCGQTISQPWIVAAICQGLELRGDESVLEIGTGSGYSAAVLARLCGRLISIERLRPLAESARAALLEAGCESVEVRVADGSLGAPDGAPFDAIAVHAALPAPPRSLLEQLGPEGRLVAPIASDGGEILTRFRRVEPERSTGEVGYLQEPLANCRFVPLIGAEGYSGD